MRPLPALPANAPLSVVSVGQPWHRIDEGDQVMACQLRQGLAAEVDQCPREGLVGQHAEKDGVGSSTALLPARDETTSLMPN